MIIWKPGLLSLNNFVRDCSDSSDGSDYTETGLKVKKSSSLKGIVIEDKEFLLSQFADNTFFLLDGTECSLRSSLKLLDSFFDICGLRINCDKTKVIWLGSKNRCSVKLLPESRPQWIHDNNFIVLSITLNLKMDDCGINLSYETKLREIDKLY